MPSKKTVRRARQAKREGKAPSTQAGEFVREEMEHLREGRHKSVKQAIAIGMARARRAGVPVKKKPGGQKRTAAERSEAAKKGARTKGAAGRSSAAKKAVRTRARRGS